MMYKMILVERELLIIYQIVYFYDNAIVKIVAFNLFALFLYIRSYIHGIFSVLLPRMVIAIPTIARSY